MLDAFDGTRRLIRRRTSSSLQFYWVGVTRVGVGTQEGKNDLVILLLFTFTQGVCFVLSSRKRTLTQGSFGGIAETWDLAPEYSAQRGIEKIR